MSDPSKGRVGSALLAIGCGLVAVVATVVTILRLTNDMRWLLVLGSSLLLLSAAWLGGRRRGGVGGLILLCLPLFAVWATQVLPELPGMWPHLAFWAAFAALGWFGFRPAGLPGSRALVALVLIVAAASWYASGYVSHEISRTLNRHLDERAPAYALQTLEGVDYPMGSLADQVVLLDFFATWCAPCVAELPELEELHHRYAEADDVTLLVVANDSGGDTPEAIRSFIEDRGLVVPFVYDRGGEAHRAFGFQGLPGLVVIDRTGRVRFKREGFNAAEDIGGQLVEIIEALRTSGSA